MTTRLAAAIITIALFDASAALAQDEAAARAVFDSYVALGRAYDPALADLYAADAVIRNRRTYPTGQVRELTIPAEQYKALIRQTMPLAKARGDADSYSNCTYSPEATRVRIRCSRYSQLKKYTSPISLLIARARDGRWLIVEELSESQP